MAKTVTATAKQTLHGYYGIASAGDSIVLEERHAKELEGKGLVEITGTTDEQTGLEKRDAVVAEGKLNITDNTGKAKEKAEQDTKAEDPAGKKKEKDDKSGPNKAAKK